MSADAKTRTGPSVAILAFGAFAVGTGLFALNGALTQAAVDVHAAPAAVGHAVTVFAVTYAIGAPLLAALAGRFEAKPMLVASLLVLVLGNLLTAAAPDLLVLLLSRIVAAIGAAAQTPAALGAAAALVPAARAGTALAVVQGGLNGALAVGVPVGVGVAAVSSWRSALLVVAVLGLAAAAAIAFGIRTLPHPSPVRPAAMLGLLRSGPALLTLTITVLAVAAVISAYTYVSAVLGATVSARGGTLLMLLVCYGVGAFVGTVAVGPPVDRAGARPVLLSTLALQVVVLAAIPLTHLLWLGFPLAVLWGVSATASTPPQQVRMISLAPDSSTLAVSLNSSGIYIGQGIGAVIGGGALASGITADRLPFIAAMVAAVALIVALFQPHRARARPPGDSMTAA